MLFDRQYGQEVGISSGPWAPPGVEKRASVFAAMLLMPPDIIEEKLRHIANTSDLEQVKTMANDLQASTTALIEHLHNIGAINVLERDKLREASRDNH